jgi:hypothetical protein
MAYMRATIAGHANTRGRIAGSLRRVLAWADLAAVPLAAFGI